MLRRTPTLLAMVMVVIAGGLGGATAQTEDEMRAVLQGLTDAMNAQDAEQYASYFADDAVMDYVPSPPPIEGKEAIAGFMAAVFQGFPDFTQTNTNVVASGNILVNEWVGAGTFAGDWLGIPPTGVGGSVPHFTVSEFEGSKIKRVTTYLDYVTFMTVVGLMPPSELPPIEPSFVLPDPEPSGLGPVETALEIAGFYDVHDLPSYAKRLRGDAEVYLAPMGITANRDLLMAIYEVMYYGFPDMKHDEIVRAIDLGDGWVLEEVVVGGTHGGPYFGVPASGSYSATRLGALLRVDEDGLITNISLYWDELGTLMAIGAIPGAEPSAVSPSSWGLVKSLFQE